MEKKISCKENFEEVYLRSKSFKRMLDSVPKEVQEAYLRDKGFTRTVEHISRLTFKKNLRLFLKYGFDSEDILSITLVYALSFLGTKQDFRTDKDKYYIMMRYINQRFEAFFLFISRKFNTKDDFTVSPRVWASGEQMPESPSTVVQPTADASRPEETLEDLEEALEFIEFKISSLRKMSLSCVPFSEEKSRVLAQKQKLCKTRDDYKHEISCMKREQREIKKEDRKLTKELKNRMEKEWPKHVDQLCYYSTSRHVAPDVRKEARNYCKKLKVDYIRWVKEYVKKHDADFHDFVL